MLIDKSLLLSDAQAFTATGVSANAIDLQAANVTVGDGEEMGLAFMVDVAAVGTGTYQFDLLSDDAASLASPTVIASRVIPAADLTVGKQHFIGVPAKTPIEQYVGLRVTLGGTSPGITITAWVAPQEHFARTWRAYPKNYVA